jgi:hypothetical protein
MKTITIKRSKWARGGMNGDSFLLNEAGNMCCLGFAANQMNRIARCELFEGATPEDVYTKASPFTNVDEDGFVKDNVLSETAIMINDNARISDKVRERRLTTLFKKFGIKIKFVD